MSKEELKPLELYKLFRTTCPNVFFETQEEWEKVLDAMVAAYNKAISDAVGCYVPDGNPKLFVERVEELKIRI